MKLKNKIVFISGANRGIGRALVQAALDAGAAKVYAGARNPEKINVTDARVLTVKLDLTNRDSILAAAKKAVDTNVLINNAGVHAFGSVLQGKVQDIENEFQTNFFGTLDVIRAFAPQMIERKEGAIANLLSIAGLAGMQGAAGYSASKAALMSVTQSLRAELAATGVSVHGVFPGPIDTEMAKDIDKPKTSAKDTAENIVMGIQEGKEDIFPDSTSIQAGTQWLKDPKELEHQFAKIKM